MSYAYPIPPAEDSCHVSGDARVLFSGGKWLIPEHQRPRDWRERMQPQEDKPKPKAERIIAVPTTPRGGFGKGHPKHGGRKQGTTTVDITAEQIVERLRAGETMRQIAAAVSCNFTLLHKRLKRAGLAIPAKHCACGAVMAPQAKRCAACKRGRAA